MINNPEFRRNIWLELTPYRLIGMPAVLAAIFLLLSLIKNNSSDILVSGALTLFVVNVCVWGIRLASESVISEIKGRTWDSQRMSSIGAWSMTWGKLLGSTIYQWYGGLLCLVVFVAIGPPDSKTFYTFVLFITAGLFGQTVTLLTSLQAVKKERGRMSSQASAFFVLGLITSIVILSSAWPSTTTFNWYGLSLKKDIFLLVSAIAFLCWAIYGIYRLMRAELQMRNGPFAWLSFVCFIAIYFAGYPGTFYGYDGLSLSLVTAYGVSVILTYAMALSERKDPVDIRRLLASYERKEWRRTLQEVPCWLITLLPVFIAGCGAVVTADGGAGGNKLFFGAPTVIAASFLFLLRDLCLIFFFNFAKNPRRADMIVVLSLAFLYWVIPGILKALGLNAATAMFWPQAYHQSFIGVVAASIELSLAIILVIKRWKSQTGWSREDAVKDVRGFRGR